MVDFKGLIIREPATQEEFDQLTELQKKVWGFDDLEVAPADLLSLHSFLGGVVLAAYDKSETPIAFCYSFYGVEEGIHMHWSHMLAVLPDYRGIGLGKALKWEQRNIILSQGVNVCKWTFDPLEILNTRLNLVTLGAISNTYKINVYGESSGFIHTGLPTDRLVANWILDSERVQAAYRGSPQKVVVDLSEIPRVISTKPKDKLFEPVKVNLDLNDQYLACPVIHGVQHIKNDEPELALNWRMATREVFVHYFSRGYQLVDVKLRKETDEQLALYILQWDEDEN